MNLSRSPLYTISEVDDLSTSKTKQSFIFAPGLISEEGGKTQYYLYLVLLSLPPSTTIVSPIDPPH